MTQEETLDAIEFAVYEFRRDLIDSVADRRLRQDLDALACVMTNMIALKHKLARKEPKP